MRHYLFSKITFLVAAALLFACSSLTEHHAGDSHGDVTETEQQGAVGESDEERAGGEPTGSSDAEQPADEPDVTSETACFDEEPQHAETIRLEPDRPIAQVSWMMTGADSRRVDYRLPAEEGEWTDWEPVEITFAEGDAYNARVIVDEPVETLELRGGPRLHDAYFSIQPFSPARRPALDAETAVRPEHARMCSDSDIYLVDDVPPETTGAELPDDLMISRQDWGAIAPGRVCRKAAEPFRVTFHHTYLPDPGDDTARAVRQMQSYHLNERGWCDIGYHFLIGPDGDIFEGSARPHRLAAHVAGQNEGNVGIALIGDFTEQAPTHRQLTAAAELTRWLNDTYDIGLDRSSIRGHGEWPGQTTACPGEAMTPFIDHIVDAARQPTDAPQPVAGQ